MLLTDVRWLFTLLIVFSFAMTSCRSAEPVSTSKPTATVVPFPTFTATPVEVSTKVLVSSPMPVAAGEPSLLLAEEAHLPASLYYLGTDRQIWRLDHMTLQHRQLTTESSPIDDFDVGPNHGRLVYVTDNQLVEFDPQTGTRVIKVSGPPVPPVQADGKHTAKEIGVLFLASPHYSPDGALIAYSHAGINLVDSGGLETATPQRLLTNTLYLDGHPPADSTVNWSRNVEELHTYAVSSWSPDSKKLLLYPSVWEGARYEIYDRATTTLKYVETNEQEPFAHGAPILGEWRWSSDSSYGIMANSGYGMPVESGLFYVDADSGVGHKLDLTSLIATVEESPFHPVARAAYEHASGVIRFFMGTRILVAEQRIFYALAEIDLTTNAVSWVQDAEERSEVELGEVLWAADGSGLIKARPSGPLQWLPADGSGVVDFDVSGTHLRWEPTAATESPISAPIPKPVPVLNAQKSVASNKTVTRKGLTWAKAEHDPIYGIDRVSCYGTPPISGSVDNFACNAYEGDTSCAVALPVLCIKVDHSPRPNYAVTGEAHAMPKEFYSGWANGHITLTTPIRGTDLTSLEAANTLCTATFGDEYRMAGFDDGKYVPGMDEGNFYDTTWPKPNQLLTGAWSFYAYGNISGQSRFWIYIKDQPSNCWDAQAINPVAGEAAKAEVPRQTNPMLSPPTPPLLAWAMAPDGAIYVLDSWMVLYELAPHTLSPVARSERLRSVVSDSPAAMAVDEERIYLAGIQFDGIQLLRRQDFSIERRLELETIERGYGSTLFNQIAIDPGRKLFIISNDVLWAYDLTDLAAPPIEVHRRRPVSPAAIPIEIRVDEKMRRLYLVVDAGLSGSGRGRKPMIYDLDSLTSIGWFSPDRPITSLPSIATMADKMVFTLDSLGGDSLLQIFSRSALFQNNNNDDVPPLAQRALSGQAIIDPTGEWIYLVERRWISVLHSSDLGWVSLIPLQNEEPSDLLFSADGESLYLMQQSGITVLNAHKLQTVGIVPIAPFPQGWITDNNAGPLFRSPQVEEDGIAFRALDDILFRSEDGGQSWSPLLDYQAGEGQSAESRQAAWAKKYSLSPTFAQDRTLLAHSGTIYRSTDAGESWAEWTPQLAFTSDRSGNRDIFTADAQGQKLQRITVHPANDETPAWSPAWTRIAFASDRSGNWDIYSIRADCAPQSVMDEAACDLRQLTTDPADDLLPAWSPDGRLIAFVSLRDGNAEIYIMNSDGSDPLRITNDPAGDWRPVWLPNANWLAFTSDRAGNNDIYWQQVRESNTTSRIGVDSYGYNTPSPWIQTAADERDLAIDANGNLIYWTNRIDFDSTAMQSAHSLTNGYIASRFAGDRLSQTKQYLTALGKVGHPSAGIGAERESRGITVSIEKADDVDIYYLDEEGAVLLIDGPGFDGHPASGPVWWDPTFAWE